MSASHPASLLTLLAGLASAALLTSCARCPGSSPERTDHRGVAARSEGPHFPRAACVSDPRPRFTAHLTDLDAIETIVPPGSMAVGNTITKNSFLVVKPEALARDGKVPVYAPAAARLDTGAHYSLRKYWNLDVALFTLTFTVTCEVSFLVDHLSEVTPKLARALPLEPTETSAWLPATEDVRVEAGELLGYTKAQNPARIFDFVVSNTTLENAFVNPGRYRDHGSLSNFLHADCPYEYYDEPLRSQYFAKLGDNGRPPAPNATCRKATQDKAGTISGAWFLEGEPDDDHLDRLAVAAEFDGTVLIGGLGRTFTNSLAIVPGDPTHRLPTDVTDRHCYELRGAGATDRAFAYFQPDGAFALIVAFARGACPAAMPQGARRYVR